MKERDVLNNDWRKVAAAVYKKPTDSKIFGSVEIDVTGLEEYVMKRRREGLRITLTHIFTLIVARALKEDVPELNAYVIRGKVVSRPQIDATVSVLLKGQQMGSVKVPRADCMTLAELSEAMAAEIKKTRSGSENKTMRMKALLGRIPWPFRGWLLSLLQLITIDWGLSLPSLGLSANSFGSFLISNIGSLGLDAGFPALLPTSNVAFVMILGGVSTKPWVVDGQIVPRRILWLGSALDHRIVDGSHGGKLFAGIRRMIKNPRDLEQKPPWCKI